MRLNKNLVLAVVLVVVAAAGGYFLWQKKHPGAAKEAKQGEQGAVLYTCAMHPFIIKDKPGTCPICGMALIKKVEGGPQASEQELAALGQVALSPTQMVMANVGTVEAKTSAMAREISAVGIVQFDQARQAKVTSWVAGRLDRLYVNTVGAYVSKGKPVAEIYSPDLVAAQQEYLLALKSREQFKNSPIQSISQGGEGLVSSARQRLRLMGVRDDQIAALEKGGEPNIRLAIYTPLSGIVIEKVAQQGQYVNVGDPLFNIADLSTVWVEVEVYENEFPNVKLGQSVSIVSQSYPGQTFRGRVAFIYPFLDPKTRTVKVRVEMANPGLKLKPDMFVNATIKSQLGSSIVVPSSAVMDTGKRQLVWVEVKPGAFEPRDVKVGARDGDNVQILSGLRAGDKVAATGGYLIDSESQLKGGGGAGGHEGHGGSAPAAGAPAPGKGGGMNMDDMNMDNGAGKKPAAPAPKKGGGLDMGDMKM